MGAIPVAKCPSCKKSLVSANAREMTIRTLSGGALNGISYSCPSCRTILSVGVDPYALMTDTVTEIVKKLKGR